MRAVDLVLTGLRQFPGTTSSWLVGEPCVAPPPELCEAFARAARSAAFPYPPIAGLPALREVFASIHDNGESAPSPQQVVVTAGSKAGLFALLGSILEPGDQLIHPQPCYPAYPNMALRLGALPVAVAEGHGTFEGWPQAVAEAITERTRAVVLSSPSNPTGATLTTAQATEMVELCRSRGIRLICDEAYGEIHLGSRHDKLCADFDPDRTTVVQIRSVSKSWALCGWRIGWVIADQDLAQRVASVHSLFSNPASGPAQEALLSLPKVEPDYLRIVNETVSGRIETLRGVLEDSGFRPPRPAGGFYLWLDLEQYHGVSDPLDSVDWCRALAHEKGVGLWPGEDFLGPGHIRISSTAPAPAEWQLAIDRLAAALA